MHLSLINYVKKFPIGLLGTIFLSSLAAVGLIFQQKIVAFIVNAIIFLELSIENMKGLLVIILIIILFRAIINFISDKYSKQLSIKIKKEIRHKIIHHFYENHNSNIHTGVVVNYIIAKVEALDDYFSKFLPQVVLSIFIPFFIIIFVFPIDLLTAFVFLLTAPLIPLFMVLIGKYGERVTKKQWLSLNNLSTFFLDSIRGIKTIIQFNQYENHHIRLEKANKDFIKKTMSVLKVTFLSAFVLELVSTLSIAIVAVQIGLRLLYSQISFEQAFFILLIAPDFYFPIRSLGLRFHAAINGVEAYKKIDELISQNDNKSNGTRSFVLDKKILKVEFSNVCFKYPGMEKELINNFSQTFEIGKCYAIVGPNGTGKSTLFSMLLTFLKPQKGSIKINGFNLMDLIQQNYFNQIGWLPANPAIFQGSIYDNIAVANSQLDKTKVDELLKIVDLNNYVDSLPEKLNTEIQDFGVSISSGQKQKIGLLRIFARDCTLILCDEPMTSLDPHAKELVLTYFNENRRNKIILLISHDLLTVKSADQVIYFDQDNTISTGNFESLTADNNSFNYYVNNYFRSNDTW